MHSVNPNSNAPEFVSHDSDPSVDHNHHDSHHPPHLDAGLLQLHRMQRPGDCDSASSRDIYSRIHCHTDL
ncbi:unnamed protein product [Pleuronectes platessa]|uniref:Uncharacterized protein n=1 Tax=Pleuronectes platessa TaxID=8262 RepID=A0A9N7V602_PLEPL|nr:unnamed protein product [Pleuronectes platessa]